MNNKTPVLNEKQLNEKLLEGQKIPSFESLNLQKNDTPLTDGLKLVINGYSYRKILINLGIASKNKIVTISETTME